ncbi:hypothetical protein AYI68_g353 [Smittium mucronatum]|uniref:Uncharacterized protein n=1 Tax=Smittium mucronatum TaxID=133383 RepID=A0A1R0H8F7_9FUNG|nr:hypothetical protein AYI68_g353 [Smittium mucronatum]
MTKMFGDIKRDEWAVCKHTVHINQFDFGMEMKDFYCNCEGIYMGPSGKNLGRVYNGFTDVKNTSVIEFPTLSESESEEEESDYDYDGYEQGSNNSPYNGCYTKSSSNRQECDSFSSMGILDYEFSDVRKSYSLLSLSSEIEHKSPFQQDFSCLADNIDGYEDMDFDEFLGLFSEDEESSNESALIKEEFEGKIKNPSLKATEMANKRLGCSEVSFKSKITGSENYDGIRKFKNKCSDNRKISYNQVTANNKAVFESTNPFMENLNESENVITNEKKNFNNRKNNNLTKKNRDGNSVYIYGSRDIEGSSSEDLLYSKDDLKTIDLLFSKNTGHNSRGLLPKGVLYMDNSFGCDINRGINCPTLNLDSENKKMKIRTI